MAETWRNATGPTEEPSKKANTTQTDCPCCHGPVDTEKRRNLVISIDGTSNKFGAKNTNVIEHHSLLEDDRQILYYNSGIGTYARPSWTSPKFIGMVLHHKIDLAIAWDFDKTVKDAYRWISENYENGDLIFMFGFSRGAFQVRVLSAMIDKVGLLRRGNELQIPFAYELYSDPATNDLEPRGPETIHERVTIAERFKRTFSYKDVKVHFVGVWDTVSSVGIVRGTKLLPGTIDGMKHVCFFRHALALDERRVKFLPEYANGGKGPDEEATRGSIPHTKEVWFAGTHSDIGGGNTLNPTLDRSRPPLRWMVYEAGAVGLRTSPFRRDLRDDEKVSVKESLTWVWWLFEYLPFRRLTYTRKEFGKETTHSLHRGKVRKIQPGQKIHTSLISNGNYSPKASAPLNLVANGNFAEILSDIVRNGQSETKELYEQWIEPDLLDHINNAIESFLKQPLASNLNSISQLLRRADGQRVFYTVIMDKLGNSNLSQGDRDYLVEESVQVLPGSTRFQFERLPSVQVKQRMGNLQTMLDFHKEFLDRFSGKRFQTYDPKLSSIVLSVAFSPDGKRFASGLDDGSVLLWDDLDRSTSQPESETSGKALERHFGPVRSLAFSPDSKRLVSGSFDFTLRLWDLEKKEQIGEPWKGHTSCVNSVAFSHDGKKVVSASHDKTLSIWDPETGKRMAILTCESDDETFIPSEVAFSPDGLHIVSGSKDGIVHIWSIASGCTYQRDGELRMPKGHTSTVLSVAYSPKGTYIASGSRDPDNTICIWHAKTREPVGVPLYGHSCWVVSVCFSPDEERLASGSLDTTIRIWDIDKGEQIGKGLCGPGRTDNFVYSVAFSHDGKTLASGLDDGTVEIWDIETYVGVSSLPNPDRIVCT